MLLVTSRSDLAGCKSIGNHKVNLEHITKSQWKEELSTGKFNIIFLSSTGRASSTPVWRLVGNKGVQEAEKGKQKVHDGIEAREQKVVEEEGDLSLETINLQDMAEENKHGYTGKQPVSQEKSDFVTPHTLGKDDSEPTKIPSPSITNTSLVGKQNEPILPISFNNAFSTNTPFSLSHQPVPYGGKQNEPIPPESLTNTSATKTLESLKNQSAPLVGKQNEPTSSNSLNTFSTNTLDSASYQSALNLEKQNEPIPPKYLKNTIATNSLVSCSSQPHHNPSVGPDPNYQAFFPHHSPEKEQQCQFRPDTDKQSLDTQNSSLYLALKDNQAKSPVYYVELADDSPPNIPKSIPSPCESFLSRDSKCGYMESSLGFQNSQESPDVHLEAMQQSAPSETESKESQSGKENLAKGDTARSRKFGQASRLETLVHLSSFAYCLVLFG
ncbi:hypothetical protein RJT34_09003 [Clitoria ternatea]|uniref:Uncharacterized protein n=1 Tax=Clitoria ternatea TaxID=43366 RepID=A0AAN9K6I2_CLITE